MARRRLVPVLLVSLLGALAAGSALEAVATGGSTPSAPTTNPAARRVLEAAANRTLQASSFGMFVLTGAGPSPSEAILYKAPDRSIESDFEAAKQGSALETVTIGALQYSGLVSGTAEHSMSTTNTNAGYFDNAVLGYLHDIGRLGGVMRHGQTFTATVEPTKALDLSLVGLLFAGNSTAHGPPALWRHRAQNATYRITIAITVARGYVVSENITGVGSFDAGSTKHVARHAAVDYFDFDSPLAIAAPGPGGVAPVRLVG